MKKFLLCGFFIMSFCMFMNSALAVSWLPFSLSSPCGCGKNAGQRLNTLTLDALGNPETCLGCKAEFEACLKCKDIKNFSHIKPYLEEVFKNLPPAEYEEYIELLKKTNYPPVPSYKYSDAIQAKAKEAWHFSPLDYKRLKTDSGLSKIRKKYGGRNGGHLWKFLCTLGNCNPTTDRPIAPYRSELGGSGYSDFQGVADLFSAVKRSSAAPGNPQALPHKTAMDSTMKMAFPKARSAYMNHYASSPQRPWM